MKIKLMAVAGIMSVLSGITACQKYKDGPPISLIPRNERVANTWTVYHAQEGDVIVTGDYIKYELYLTDDGKADLLANYKKDGVTYNVDTDGTWQFTNNDEHLYFDFEDNTQDGEYLILKLTESQMSLRKIGDDLELQFGEK